MKWRKPMKRFLELVIKGIPVGMSNTLPGVSGGTMALVLNIYKELIDAFKLIKIKFLFPVFIGGMSGVFLGSWTVTGFLERWPYLTGAFLAGLILASSKVTLEKSGSFNIKKLFLGIGGLLIAYFTAGSLMAGSGEFVPSLLRYFLGGVTGSMAMILPGVSGGTLLIVFGVYQGVLEAIRSLNFLVIFIFGGGVGLGLILFSWLLSYLLEEFPELIMSFLTGLIIGSVRNVIPPVMGFAEALAAAGGALFIFLLIYLEKRAV